MAWSETQPEHERSQTENSSKPTSAPLLRENAQLYAERASMLETLANMEKIQEQTANTVSENSQILNQGLSEIKTSTSQTSQSANRLEGALASEISKQIGDIHGEISLATAQSLAAFEASAAQSLASFQQELTAQQTKTADLVASLASQRAQTAKLRDWLGTILLASLAILVPVAIIWAILTDPQTNWLNEIALWLSNLWEPAGIIFKLVIVLALIALPTWIIARKDC